MSEPKKELSNKPIAGKSDDKKDVAVNTDSYKPEKVLNKSVVNKGSSIKADSTVKKELDVKRSPKEFDYIQHIKVGNTVKVFYKIIEGNKERVQPFEGIIISCKGMGISKTFTVRRVGAGNIGVERIFPVYSPKIVDIKVLKRAKVRRAKLYYLRGLKGRRESKLKELKN